MAHCELEYKAPDNPANHETACSFLSYGPDLRRHLGYPSSVGARAHSECPLQRQPPTAPVRLKPGTWIWALRCRIRWKLGMIQLPGNQHSAIPESPVITKAVSIQPCDYRLWILPRRAAVPAQRHSRKQAKIRCSVHCRQTVTDFEQAPTYFDCRSAYSQMVLPDLQRIPSVPQRAACH